MGQQAIRPDKRGLVICLTLCELLFINPLFANPQKANSAREAIAQAHGYDCNYAHRQGDLHKVRDRDRDKAIAFYQQALKLQPDNSQRLHVLYRMAQLYGTNYRLELGEKPRYHTAIRLYEKIIENYPAEEPLVYKAMITIGDHYISLREFDQALSWFKKALEYDTDKLENHLNSLQDDPEGKEQAAALTQSVRRIKRYQEIAVDQVAYAAGLLDPVLSCLGELGDVALRYEGSPIAARANTHLSKAMSDFWTLPPDIDKLFETPPVPDKPRTETVQITHRPKENTLTASKGVTDQAEALHVSARSNPGICIIGIGTAGIAGVIVAMFLRKRNTACF